MYDCSNYYRAEYKESNAYVAFSIKISFKINLFSILRNIKCRMLNLFQKNFLTNELVMRLMRIQTVFLKMREDDKEEDDEGMKSFFKTA